MTPNMRPVTRTDISNLAWSFTVGTPLRNRATRVDSDEAPSVFDSRERIAFGATHQSDVTLIQSIVKYFAI